MKISTYTICTKISNKEELTESDLDYIKNKWTSKEYEYNAKHNNWRCPYCNDVIYKHYPYCPMCGQKLRHTEG